MSSDGPHALRRTLIKSTVGHVKRSAFDLPDSKNADHVYGLGIPRDPEGAGQVIGQWVHATPSPAAECGRNFIETNKQAISHGCLTAEEARQFAVDHPEIVVKTPVKRKSGWQPSSDAIYGMRSAESDDVNALIQARYTDFAKESDDYPDLTNMKIKGKLPLPRETKTSILKNIRTNGTMTAKEPSSDALFKMTKFKKVTSTLHTQPTSDAPH